MPQVRRIRDGDVETLRRVRLAALETDPGAFSATFDDEVALSDEAWQDRVVRAATGSRAATFFSFAHGHGCTGLVTMLRRDTLPSSAELVSMWTDPNHRSCGTGTALVDAASEWASDAGFDSVRLWVVAVNDAARRFYDRRGFVEINPGVGDAADPCRDQIRMERRL